MFLDTTLLVKIKSYLRKVKYLKKYYLFASLVKEKIIKKIDNFRFKKFIKVFKNDKYIFSILEMGKVTRMRAKLFETKEPETLRWIDGFDKEDIFLDIGANVGVYSLYAALRKIKVISLEPDALNYAMLNINLRKNNLSEYILPYSIALNDVEKFNYFNISSDEWGGALNSFGNELDYRGNKFKTVHRQGVYGLPLDMFLSKVNKSPNHIKIDVDGNEYLILKGAENTLKSKYLKSLLVELDESRSDFEASIELITKCGFILLEKTHGEMFDNSEFSSTYNHIFIRK